MNKSDEIIKMVESIKSDTVINYIYILVKDVMEDIAVLGVPERRSSDGR